MALINHVPKHSHTLSFHSKMQINSGKIQINWNRQWAKRAGCGLTVGGREHSDLTYNSANYQWRKRAKRPDIQFANWLWPYCCRKGAERPDLQQCKLPVKERSTATWHTIFLTVSQTVVGREQSDLMDNTICSCTDCCWKGAQWPDLQQCKLTVKEGSIATWRTILLTVSQTVVGREQSDLMDNTIYSCADRCWKGAKRPDGQHYLQLHRLL